MNKVIDKRVIRLKRLKKTIQDGTYEVSSTEVAKAMLERYAKGNSNDNK